MRNHRRECVRERGEEKTLKEEALHQTSSGLKRKLEPDMVGASASLLNTSHSQLGSAETQKTMKTDSEGNIAEIGESKRSSGIDPPRNISIRYGSAKYSVLIEPERKMGRVMRKLARMVGKPVDKLVFKVERSGKVVTGLETMKDFVGEVIIVHNL